MAVYLTDRQRDIIRKVTWHILRMWKPDLYLLLFSTPRPPTTDPYNSKLRHSPTRKMHAHTPRKKRQTLGVLGGNFNIFLLLYQCHGKKIQSLESRTNQVDLGEGCVCAAG